MPNILRRKLYNSSDREEGWDLFKNDLKQIKMNPKQRQGDSFPLVNETPYMQFITRILI